MNPSAVLAQHDHRPWAMPTQPWALAMEWHDLLFMHWPVPVAALREHIPASLTVDTLDGTAWIGVVPFRMAEVRPHFLPSVPWLSAFPELNLRTYVTTDGKPGVWFFSLDASNPVAVRIARGLFNLPYFDATMQSENQGETVRYASTRTHRNAPPVAFHGSFRPCGPAFASTAGSIEQWLTERYCLYTAGRRGQALRCEIHHQHWPLQPATAEVAVNTVANHIGLTLPNTEPLLHFARRLDVVAWTPRQV